MSSASCSTSSCGASQPKRGPSSTSSHACMWHTQTWGDRQHCCHSRYFWGMVCECQAARVRAIQHVVTRLLVAHTNVGLCQQLATGVAGVTAEPGECMLCECLAANARAIQHVITRLHMAQMTTLLGKRWLHMTGSDCITLHLAAARLDCPGAISATQ
jgi:hypothetical protein